MKKLLLILFGIIMFISPYLERSYAQIAIIVNHKNPISHLTLLELKQLYLGKISSFPDGSKVVLLEYSPLRAEFYRSVLNMTPFAVSKHWIRLIFSGNNMSPPKKINDPEEIVNFVRRNKGAICFIESTRVDDRIKAVKIDRKIFLHLKSERK